MLRPAALQELKLNTMPTIIATWPAHWVAAARKADLLSAPDFDTGEMKVAYGLLDNLAHFAALIEAAERERISQAKPRAWMPPDNEGQPHFMVYAEPGEDYIPLFELSAFD